MPLAFRIVKASLAGEALGGEGASLYGGRWNSPGTEVVYTAQSESLAMLELLVHLGASDLLQRYVTMRVEFERELVQSVAPAALPARWRASPAPAELQVLGDRWASERRSAVLRVPSALVPRESNYLLNPSHPDFRRLVIGAPEPCTFDSRLR
jgi:RES domain-containing protein